MELSLNTHEKTDDQKKKINENMFNSEITDKNSPINAIRRVVSKKKKKMVRPPGISGAIEEDVEGEDQDDAAEEGAEEALARPVIDERVQAEMSSDEGEVVQEKAKKIDFKMGKAEPKDTKSDKDKDKKDKEKKDKKESKKEKEKIIEGYNQEDIDKGKKLMSNTSFKSNLDKLRQKFKDAGKSGIEESPSVPSKKSIKESTTKAISIEVKTADVYGVQSDVMLGHANDAPGLHTSTYETHTKGLKEVGKAKAITPSVKFGLTPKNQEGQSVVSKKEDGNGSEISDKKKIKVTESAARAIYNKDSSFDEEKSDTYNNKEKELIVDSRGKTTLSKEDKELADAEWRLNNENSSKLKVKTAAPVMMKGEDSKTNDLITLPKKKKKYSGDSDNSWDGGKNPFE